VSRQNDADGGFKRADAAIGNRPGLRFLLALILLSLASCSALAGRPTTVYALVAIPAVISALALATLGVVRRNTSTTPSR